MKPQLCAVIPARGGSKGILHKNLRPLAGKSLIAWSVEAARGAACVSRVVVSTDSWHIAEEAVRAGAEVPCPASGGAGW
jgi:CMP-N,N'-diacetyllegionaminic acid synthase